MGALSHIKVLDLSRILAGPWASQVLGDLGAEVIKVENPQGGDDTRQWGPPYMQDEHGHATEESAYFMCANRNKRSVCIDMRTAEGQDKLRELARDCDVLIENFKVGGAAKYGLDYTTLSELNPGLVYCSITGFGQDGPLANRPGYDFLVQAMGGLMSVTGAADGEPGAGPQKVGVALTDIMTGLYAVIGIQAALADRAQSGLGQHVDLALLDVTAATLANQATNYLVGGLNPTRLGNAHPNIVPYQSFVAKDGYLIVAVGNDGQFRRYCQVIGAPELADDERFQTNRDRVGNRDALVPLLQVKMLERDKAEWIALLEAANVPAGPINSVGEVFAEPQIQARGMQVNLDHPLNSKLQLVGNPIKLSRTPVEYRQAPPTLGQHNEDFL
ncbi:MAG: CaiB/BaiF CoA-transferase family protein [Halioglobus sp.]|jgi:crotonobetainyl-CoA:carnitine CoA-transferase CaiB-like acyl-CoA transferase|nr:CAIB/BAIF family protein [marine gamma proteobacterium HTCC2148]MBT3411407.1 CoA transferase [Halieaceae bacterium]MDG2327874.1 CaiB/BaiF CoA-transferase family protein [Halioglobus sp.]MBT5006450.1 CoA transferase [Halieaceae bacterium]MBT6124896.1 CoA transferase [Halieaceae bacterium]